MADVRLDSLYVGHHKTVKLQRRCGAQAALDFQTLWLFCALNAGRESGDLSGMTDEDIEISARWTGEPGAFAAALADVGYLDGEPGRRSIHDFAEHQPWVSAAPERSARSRRAGLSRQHASHSDPVDGCPKCERPASAPLSAPLAHRTATAQPLSFPSPSLPSPSLPEREGGAEPEAAPASTGQPQPAAGASSAIAVRPVAKARKPREPARDRAERRRRDFRQWMAEPYEGYESAVAFWAVTFPAYDGQSGRATLRQQLEGLEAWYATAPASKERKTGAHWVTARLRDGYQRLHASHQMDMKQGVIGKPSEGGRTGKVLTADERRKIEQMEANLAAGRRRQKEQFGV